MKSQICILSKITDLSRVWLGSYAMVMEWIDIEVTTKEDRKLFLSYELFLDMFSLTDQVPLAEFALGK